MLEKLCSKISTGLAPWTTWTVHSPSTSYLHLFLILFLSPTFEQITSCSMHSHFFDEFNYFYGENIDDH